MKNYIILERDYDFVEHLESDFYEFNSVKFDKDRTDIEAIDKFLYDIHKNGFVWLDSFGLRWNMSMITIVKKIDGTYDIVAVRD